MAVLRLAIVLGVFACSLSVTQAAFLKAALGLRIGLSPEEKGYGQPVQLHGHGPAVKGQFLTGVQGKPPHGHHGGGGHSHGGGGNYVRHLKILGVNLYLGGPKSHLMGVKPGHHHGPKHFQGGHGNHLGGHGNGGNNYGYGGSHYNSPSTNQGGLDYTQNEVIVIDGNKNGQGGYSSNQVGKVFSGPNQQTVVYVPAASQYPSFDNAVQNEIKILNGQGPSQQQQQQQQQQRPQAPTIIQGGQGQPQPQHSGPPPPPHHYKGPGGPPPPSGFSLASLMKGAQWAPKSKFRLGFFPFRSGPPPPLPHHRTGYGPPMHFSNGPPPPPQYHQQQQQQQQQQNGQQNNNNNNNNQIITQQSQNTPTQLKEVTSPPGYSTLFPASQLISQSTNIQQGSPIQHFNTLSQQQQNGPPRPAFNYNGPSYVPRFLNQGQNSPSNSPQNSPPQPPQSQSQNFFANFQGPPAFSPMPSGHIPYLSAEGRSHFNGNTVSNSPSPFDGGNQQESQVSYSPPGGQSGAFSTISSQVPFGSESMNPFASERQREFAASNSGQSPFSSGPQGPGDFTQGGNSSPRGQIEYNPNSHESGPPDFGTQTGQSQVEYGPGSGGPNQQGGQDQVNVFNQNTMPFQLPMGYQYSHTVSSPIVSMGTVTHDDPPVMMDSEPMHPEFASQLNLNTQNSKDTKPQKKQKYGKRSNKESYTGGSSTNNFNTQIQSPNQFQKKSSSGQTTTMMTSASTNSNNMEDSHHIKNNLKKWKPVEIYKEKPKPVYNKHKYSTSTKASVADMSQRSSNIVQSPEIATVASNASDDDRSQVIRKRTTTTTAASTTLPSTMTTNNESKSSSESKNKN